MRRVRRPRPGVSSATATDRPTHLHGRRVFLPSLPKDRSLSASRPRRSRTGSVSFSFTRCHVTSASHPSRQCSTVEAASNDATRRLSHAASQQDSVCRQFGSCISADTTASGRQTPRRTTARRASARTHPVRSRLRDPLHSKASTDRVSAIARHGSCIRPRIHRRSRAT